MEMYLGVIVNAAACLLGGLIGGFIMKVFKKHINKKITDSLSFIIAVFIIIFGIINGIKTKNPLYILISLIAGTLIGELLGLEKHLNKLITKWSTKKKNQVTEDNLDIDTTTEDTTNYNGFISASLLFCVGTMAILGPFESVLQGKNDILVTKSIMDFITAIVLSTTLGFSVALSSISVLIYQGIFLIIAILTKDAFSPTLINEFSAMGGVLLFVLGINMMGFKKLSIINILPSLLIFIILGLIFL